MKTIIRMRFYKNVNTMKKKNKKMIRYVTDDLRHFFVDSDEE